MTEWHLRTSVCLATSCVLVYRSDDGLLGLHVHSGGRKKDRKRYFVWDWPDASEDFATEAQARAALQAQETAP